MSTDSGAPTVRRRDFLKVLGAAGAATATVGCSTGDVEKLVTIGRGIPRVVQKLQLYVDRRQFRPWLSVGTITDRTTAPYLEDLVARLDRFSGRSWTQESVTLLKHIPQNTDHPYEVVEELPLGD